ncbi:molecular chaperone DnaJ [uncultured Brevundimonas sp.]|uniref:molecular chaperone DnaJ n=1 Tax=uncultured Brevundimonas sp. TaxID=213418 RepID=UPI0030EC4608|tara:strand:- start:1993 stop:2412 length:420 start_codon:yes stop_codon:yes gene_type:complete
MGLIWLALAGIAVWALARLGRQTEGPRRGHWRVAATLLSAVLLAGGALAASRGAWLPAAGLLGTGLWLVLSSRIRQVAARPEAMSDAEARSVLGVGADATSEQIQAAWRRLMTRAHPDQGGSEGLASRLNAARDRLRKG